MREFLLIPDVFFTFRLEVPHLLFVVQVGNNEFVLWVNFGQQWFKTLSQSAWHEMEVALVYDEHLQWFLTDLHLIREMSEGINEVLRGVAHVSGDGGEMRIHLAAFFLDPLDFIIEVLSFMVKLIVGKLRNINWGHCILLEVKYFLLVQASFPSELLVPIVGLVDLGFQCFKHY